VRQTAESTSSALAEPRELFETVLRHLHDGIVVMSAAGELIYANEAGARLSGYATAAEMLAAPPGEAGARFLIFDVNGKPLAPERLPSRRALAGEEPEPMVVRFRAGPELPDRLSEVRSVAVRDARGAVLYAVTFFREVTSEVARSDEQRAAADQYAELYREAQRTTALLDALYGAAPVGLGFWDRDLRYVRVNEKLAEINERPAHDHVGRTFAEVVPQLAHVLEPMARRVLKEREAVIALEVTAGSPSMPDAPRHWLASYYPVLAANGEALGVGCVIEEVTDRRRAEQRTALQLAVTGILAIADATADAVPRVLETICESLGWDVAFHWSTDPDHPPVTWARPGRQFDGFVALTQRAALSSAMLAGRVASSGKAEWLDEMNHSTFARASVAVAEGLKSGVAFPVLVEGEVVGVLEAFASVRVEEDTELMETLTAIGGQLGQFLRRKRAEDERRQLLQRERIARAEAEAAASTLRKLGRVSEAALEHSSLADLLGSLLARIVEVLEADTAAILLVEDDGALHLRATVGLGAEVERAVAIPIGAGMAGRVAALRTPLLAPDLSKIELFSPVLRERGINSLVAIPLIVEDRVIGVVHAGSVAFAQFVDDDARLLELIADRIAIAINQAALYEAERVAQERLHFLGEASTMLASSLDVDATLARVAQLAVPHFADWCAVDLVDATGAINRLAIEHVEPEQVELARRIVAAFPHSLDDELGVGAAIRTGEAMLSAEIGEAALRAAFGDRPAYLDQLLRLDLTSIIVVPLIARDRTLGALTFVSAESGRRYGAADLQFAQELAARAAIAVDNAHLYRAAERRRDRLAFLAEASELLGSSLDVDRTLERLGRLLAERFADWVAIHLVRAEGPARLMTISHGDDAKRLAAEAELQAFASDREPPLLVARVLESGTAERWAPTPGMHPPGSLEHEEGLHSGLIAPLIARSRILGTLSLVRGATAEPYDDDDIEFAEDIARRAAIAIDNAQLYREAEERAQAARVLASVGDGVFFVDRNGIVRTWNRAAGIATGLALPDVVDRLAVDAIPGWAEIVARIPIVAAGSAPPRAETLPLDLGGRELWLSIHGVVVADGIVYAFRDQTEERALETMRTEFVSTVSHELRTPLAAIYGAAMTLRRKDVALDDGQRASLLDVVSGEADRLARTVNDILWASRLDTDTLHVTIQNCDLLGLARDVVEAQLVHLDPAHALLLSAEPDLPLVAGDPDKVGRVLINLVDNAIKYSPDGGRVEVKVQLAGSHVRFSVTDPGLGIPAPEQRRIFEKFYRLDPNMNRGVGGTGLGLYICRELVRRMEGRIWVDSEGRGAGSTFHVELPVAGDFTAHLRSAPNGKGP
jgi:signal transduction histidine kinase/putative methionine-R-sulfoxide reductase with GAF domain